MTHGDDVIPTPAALASPVAQPMHKGCSAEGLRGVAAVNVLLTHLFVAFFPNAYVHLYPGLQKSPARMDWPNT